MTGTELIGTDDTTCTDEITGADETGDEDTTGLDDTTGVEEPGVVTGVEETILTIGVDEITAFDDTIGVVTTGTVTIGFDDTNTGVVTIGIVTIGTDEWNFLDLGHNPNVRFWPFEGCTSMFVVTMTFIMGMPSLMCLVRLRNRIRNDSNNNTQYYPHPEDIRN